MRSIINLILICACAVTASAREEYKRDFSKSVTLGGGKTFRIENSLGNITVHTHAGSDAAIHATIRCSADNAGLAKSAPTAFRSPWTRARPASPCGPSTRATTRAAATFPTASNTISLCPKPRPSTCATASAASM